LSIGVLPGYDDYPLSDRVAPRIYSRLAKPDELRITSLTYGSPLDLILSGVPYVVGGFATYLGAKGALTDTVDGVADVLNLRAHIRSKHTKLEADTAHNQLRQARYEKSLRELKNINRGGRDPDKKYAPLPEDTRSPIERELHHVETAGFLLEREVTRVRRVAGIPDIG
jgi:hypothetical protein